MADHDHDGFLDYLLTGNVPEPPAPPAPSVYSFDEVVLRTGGYPGMWYLGSPYSKFHLGIEAAWIEACRLAGRLMAAGIPVYSPIAHSHPIAIYAGMDPYDYNIWVPHNQIQMDCSTGLIVARMEGWRESFGLAEEIKWFEKRRLPVFHLEVAKSA